MTNRPASHVAAVTIALLLCASSGWAQVPASSFEELRGLVDDGDEVIVVRADGLHMQGKLVTLTPSAVNLVVDERRFLVFSREVPQELSEAEVTTVTRIDSRSEGGYIGFAIGFGLAASGCLADDADAEPFSGTPTITCATQILLGGPIFGSLGALIGRFIDGTINAAVYQAETPRKPVSITPMVVPKGAGALVSVRF